MKERLDFFQKKGIRKEVFFYYNKKKEQIIKSDILFYPYACQGDVCASYHHPANGLALVFLLYGMFLVGLSDWVEYNFGRLIPYRASTAGRVCISAVRRTELVLISSLCVYVRHGACNMHRDLKPDEKRHGSHQDDQGDCIDSNVDCRMNNSNAEMMINAIKPRTFFLIFPSLIITVEGDLGGGRNG